MAFLAAIALPAYVSEPRRSLGGGGAFGLAVFVAFEVFLFSLAQRRVFLRVNAESGTLTIREARWPLPERTEDIPIADIGDVTLDRAPRSPAVRIVLVLHSGATRALTESYFARSTRMEHDSARLRDMTSHPFRAK